MRIDSEAAATASLVLSLLIGGAFGLLVGVVVAMIYGTRFIEWIERRDEVRRRRLERSAQPLERDPFFVPEEPAQ
jgi:NhaP-type Na+/H+ or K+/H+ antiporter